MFSSTHLVRKLKYTQLFSYTVAAATSRLLWPLPTWGLAPSPVHLSSYNQHLGSGLHPQRRSVMAGALDKDVQQALKALLPTLDLDTTTERRIREMLAEKLGTPMDPYKKLIKQEIDTFLTEGPPAAEQQQEDVEGIDDDFESSEAAGKRKRSAAAADAGAQRAKAARSSGASGPAGGIQLDTQGLKWLSVSPFKGQLRVDIRTFFRTKDDDLAPTKKGISLSQQEWSALQEVLPQLSAAVDADNQDFAAELPNGIRATTSLFQGKLQVGIREYYDDGGELKPGRRGINLLPDQLHIVLDSVPDINKQLGQGRQAGTAAAKPAPAAAAARQKPPAAAAAAAAGGAGASRPAAGRAGAGAAGGGSGSSDGSAVDLGGKKRAAISTFTGRPCVDLREVYEKDGQMLPGKKGIMLQPDQWRKLVEGVDDINTALSSRDTSYRLSLGSNREVSISEFRGVWYVGVRDYYQQNGEMRPGAKGLNMNKDQWQKLVAGMDVLDGQLA